MTLGLGPFFFRPHIFHFIRLIFPGVKPEKVAHLVFIFPLSIRSYFGEILLFPDSDHVYSSVSELPLFSFIQQIL